MTVCLVRIELRHVAIWISVAETNVMTESNVDLDRGHVPRTLLRSHQAAGLDTDVLPLPIVLRRAGCR